MGRRVRLFYAAWIACVAVIAVALCGIAGRAMAADASCQPVSAVQAQLAPILGPVHGEIVILMGADAAAYLDVLNSQPPVTHLAGDGVLLAVVPDKYVVVGVIKDGIACAVGHIASDLHAKALASVSGHKA